MKVCNDKIADWPPLLPYALWANQTTHSSVTIFMPTEVMLGQKAVMLVEQPMVSWVVLPWKEEMTREDLLTLRMR